MKHPVRTLLTASAFAALVALALPSAASANAIYPPSGSCTVSPATASAGETLRFQCAAETFSPDEPVTITVTGENGSGASIGMIKFAISTASGTARSTEIGSLPAVPITLPSNASGTYIIAAVSPTSAGSTAAATVSNASGGLPTTGMDSASLTGLWIGGGALVLAGAALGVTAMVRRSRNNAD
ncbi:cell wall protein [Microbacterium sp. zg.B48]|uniref:cell wall protein n=1 Tax=unclassified Microbacterium TaxID=2609290 RepID=UPI00214BFF80|nr:MULTISPECIES: cell wall protein [unclassified Microbacterium]MCR2763274.1 cell wall protein [Microbacterium sp. zg.B48]MCR2808863.1 cell wall protein [Microbacterium sp. zg.B185]WIM18718.1 cell wall protein [Microbacterium sp. zg-B185]